MIEKDNKSVDKKTLKCEHGAYIRRYIWVEKVNAMSCLLVCGASRAKFRSVKPRFIGVHISSPKFICGSQLPRLRRKSKYALTQP